MKLKTFSYLITLILVLGLAACKAPTEKAFDEQLASQLQTALEEAVENPEAKFPGAVLYVSSSELGTWTGAAGLGNIDTSATMRSDDKFRAGSVMKPFVSVVGLQLIEEGLFSLDDPMPAVLPESVTARFSEGDKITVRMLLNHTGGIADWLTEAVISEIAANPQKIWKEEEYLDLAAAQEPYFAPGKGWKYSNTDYNLLGLVIEQATGRSWRQEVRERIIERFNLENTLLPEPGDTFIPNDHARGYIDMGGKMVDFTGVDPSMAGAAGGQALATTTTDLAQFLTTVLAGELFQNAGTLDEMLTFVDAPYIGGQVGYGLGMMKYLLPGGVEMLGHSGGTAGFQCLVVHMPAQNITISMAMTNMESDPTLILYLVLEILIPEFTPPPSPEKK